jgi:hypothetical protein
LDRRGPCTPRGSLHSGRTPLLAPCRSRLRRGQCGNEPEERFSRVGCAGQIIRSSI